MKSKEIYLQIDNGDDNPITWATDQIYDTDIKYVSSDVVKELEDKLIKYENCINCKYNSECDNDNKSSLHVCYMWQPKESN